MNITKAINLQTQKLLLIQEIQNFLGKHPIGAINPEVLMKLSISKIQDILENFQNDLIRKPGE